MIKKIFRSFIALLLCFCTIAATQLINVTAATSGDLKKQIQALESKLDKSKEESAKLQAEINSKKNEARTLEDEIATLDDETTSINNQLVVIDALIAEWELRSEEEKERLSELREEEKEEKARFDNMVRMSYEYGSDSYMELIFGAEDFGDFLQRLDLISYHLNYNEKVLKALNETQNKLIESQKNYEESRKSVDEYKISQEQLLIQLQMKIDEATEKKGQLLATLDTLESADEKINSEIDQLVKQTEEKSKELKIVEAAEMERRRKEEEAARLKNNQNQSTKKNNVTAASELAGTGDFIWPLPSNYKRISSGFVSRINPITGKRENHNGFDLPAPSRTVIYASAGGTVVIAGKNGGFGNCVTINHGNGYITLYGHCSALNVSSGDTVKQGDVIAYVGTTGLSTGNHLHFTIYKDGVAQNPGNYIS